MDYSSYGKQANSDRGCFYGNKTEANKFIYKSEPQQSSNFQHVLTNLSNDKVKLSVEVEIANSLKNIIDSPERDVPSLLDVTIVQPSNFNSRSGTLDNTVSMKRHEVKDLIVALDRQNRHTKELDQQELNVNASQHRSPNRPETEAELLQNLYTRKKKLRRNSPKGKQIAVMSFSGNPNQCTQNVNPAAHQSYIETPHRTQHKPSPINFLKPMVGEIKESLKHLENNINYGGDHLNYINVDQLEEQRVCPMELPNTHQVYATANTLDKLKTLYSCQHPERSDNQKLNFCSCNNCEMIGVLMDSQKRPFMYPATSQRTDDDFGRLHQRKQSKTKYVSERIKQWDYETVCLLRDLSNRLDILEQKVIDQEDRYVPRDYFKKIVRKIIERKTPTSQSYSINACNSSTQFKNIATQCSRWDKIEKQKSKKNVREPKYRNVQIQQNTRREFIVNPVMIDHETNVAPQKSTNVKDFKTNPITVISDFFVKKADSSPKTSDKDNKSALETFLRWGEEIIKPGFDLKTKILNLLDEQLNNLKYFKQEEPKVTEENSLKEEKNTFSHCKNLNCPRSSCKKGISTPSDEKGSNSGTSNRTLKKMLNLMSEKIYADHVKPAVEAIKQENKVITNSGITHIQNIKKAIDEAVAVSKTVKTNHSGPGCTKGWKKDFLEPLEIPSLIKSKTNDVLSLKQPKSSKRSAIPVRVGNTNTVENCVCEKNQNVGHKDSYIPYFKSEQSSEKVLRKPKHAERGYKRQQKMKYLQKENQNGQSVQVKYMSPRTKYWHEDSTASILDVTSQDSLR